MKIIRELTQEEFKAAIPAGLLAAFQADAADIIYCDVCDGPRVKKHECVEWYPGVKKLYEARGLIPKTP